MKSIFVDKRGVIRAVYNDRLDLRPLGNAQIQRAGHVEPAPNGTDWRVSLPDGTVVGDFNKRDAALQAEELEVVRRLRHEEVI